VLGTTTFIPIENGGTGSTSKNFVDLTTDQSITGTKTFSSTNVCIHATSSDSSIIGISSGNSSTIAGVYGRNDNGTGVYGYSLLGNGVMGVSSSWKGVQGQSTTGDGVYGQSSSGSGLYGLSSSGAGVAGYSPAGTGILAKSNTGVPLKIIADQGSRFISFVDTTNLEVGYIDNLLNVYFKSLKLSSFTSTGVVTNNGSGDLLSIPVLGVDKGGTGSSIQNFVDLTSNQTKTGSLTATAFITSGATTSQFVKGDGSLDSSSYQKTTLTQNKIWMGNASNVATETNTYLEWATGITSPGQKEVKGLITEMITGDGSTIAIPVVFHKTITLTTTTAIQLLSDTYAGRYYVIDSISIIARSPSFSQYPTISIGNNSSSYNNIVAATTLSSLAAGRNALTLTAAAQNATVEAASSLYLNITQAAIGTGTFEVIIRGFLTNL
jgi:hypothetical protein